MEWETEWLPVWVEDELMDKCALCSQPFHVFNRKVRSRYCGEFALTFLFLSFIFIYLMLPSLSTAPLQVISSPLSVCFLLRHIFLLASSSPALLAIVTSLTITSLLLSPFTLTISLPSPLSPRISLQYSF